MGEVTMWVIGASTQVCRIQHCRNYVDKQDQNDGWIVCPEHKNAALKQEIEQMKKERT